MQLYNALTGKKESYERKEVKMYVCGITPYDVTHLGHAFTYCFFDVLARYFRYQGKQVKYIQNVTDIDDDILRKAKELQQDWQAVVQENVALFLEQQKQLRILKPDGMPYASEHIKPMLKLIEKLLEKEVAYAAGGSIYFSATHWKEAGVFIGTTDRKALLTLANQRGNIADDKNKKDALDFPLWQQRKQGEPYWESPYGQGRPGWHIGCSAMALEHLGETIDIHGGGADLQFPHHAAEITQSEQANATLFSRFWLHTGMVIYQKEKMSKSLGNLIFVSDLLKTYSANAIRILLLSHHYRESWEYTQQDIETAAAYEKELMQPSKSPTREVSEQDFFDALDDDMDTPKALHVLTELARAGEKEKLKKLGAILGLQV